MNEIINTFTGSGKNLTALQMSMLAFVMFFITLIMIWISGRRTISRNSPLDMINVIVLGSIIARGIAGASAFGATVAASAVMVLVHRWLGWVTTRNKVIEKWVNGNCIVLYQHGHMEATNLKKVCISTHKLYESLRLETKEESFDKIDKAYMGMNSRISFILKKEPAA